MMRFLPCGSITRWSVGTSFEVAQLAGEAAEGRPRLAVPIRLVGTAAVPAQAREAAGQHEALAEARREALAPAGHLAEVVDLDMAEVAKARTRIPSLSHDRPYAPPETFP